MSKFDKLYDVGMFNKLYAALDAAEAEYKRLLAERYSTDDEVEDAFNRWEGEHEEGTPLNDAFESYMSALGALDVPF